jgi:hypothetical protein
MGKKVRLSSGKPGCRIVILILIILIIIGVFLGIRYGCNVANIQKLFGDHIQEYTVITGLNPNFQSENSYIRGKVITVDIGENKLDQIYFDLPGDMAAKNPEEVGTIIWLKWEDVRFGTYLPGGGTAYQRTCEVTIIDKLETIIVDKKSFTGTSPPPTMLKEGDGYGSKPTDEVVDYLESLPRQ